MSISTESPATLACRIREITGLSCSEIPENLEADTNTSWRPVFASPYGSLYTRKDGDVRQVALNNRSPKITESTPGALGIVRKWITD